MKKMMALAAVASLSVSFVATVDAATNTTKLGQTLDKHTAAIQKAILVEKGAKITASAAKQVAVAKKDVAAVKKVVGTVKDAKQKKLLAAKLNVVQAWISRAETYNKAVAATLKLNAVATSMAAAVNGGEAKATIKAAESFLVQYGTLETVAANIYGERTQDAFLAAWSNKVDSVTSNYEAVLTVASAYAETTKALAGSDEEVARTSLQQVETTAKSLEQTALKTSFASLINEAIAAYEVKFGDYSAVEVTDIK